MKKGTARPGIVKRCEMSEIRAPGQRVRSFYEARLKMFYRNRVDTTRASDKITYYLLIDGIG
jgi:CBS-domain-containing membrane protein